MDEINKLSPEKILNIQNELARIKAYQKLSKEESLYYRGIFKYNIPPYFSINGDNRTLSTHKGTHICNGYDRIVVGDYGAFVEFSEEQVIGKYEVAPGQEYRIKDLKYSKNIKYIWLTVLDGSDVKIYYQKKRVSYADYIPGKYYVSVYEVFPIVNTIKFTNGNEITIVQMQEEPNRSRQKGVEL